MFLKRGNGVPKKLRGLLLELLVVFVGVYMAFLLQSFNENKKVQKERDKVYSALKFELEFFRYAMPGMSGYMEGVWNDLYQTALKGEYESFSDWYFIEPQYGYKIIEYAINLENTDIVNFQLYDKLQGLYTAIKKLEHSERLMMEVSELYLRVPEESEELQGLIQLRHLDNLENYGRFLTFMKSRTEGLQAVADQSTIVLALLNKQMAPEIKVQIEEEIILRRLGRYKTEEEAVEKIGKQFPGFNEKRVIELFKSL